MQPDWESYKKGLLAGDRRSLARTISLVENEAAGHEEFLKGLPPAHVPVIGITGPPGAGKSTLTDGLVQQLVARQNKVGVLCVDPSSPFNMGALLGDRIRMSSLYLHPDIYIRSLASRGSLGGLHPRIIEIIDVMKRAGFDYIVVETVGVGQSEIEIAGLADCTVVVLVPEAGDEIQTMKAGLMEIADLFVVNKADRPEADLFVNNLRKMLAPVFARDHSLPVIKTVAIKKQGLEELAEAVLHILAKPETHEKRQWLLAEKAWQLLVHKRMKGITRSKLKNAIDREYSANFNLYAFVEQMENAAYFNDMK